MKLDDLATGTATFVDANIYVYALGGDVDHGPSCVSFLERIEQGDLRAFTDSVVFSDVAHRLMTLEACSTFGWPYRGIGSRLKGHPAEVRSLTKFRVALMDIVATGTIVLPTTAAQVIRAAELSIQHGLLSHDGLILASMESQALTALASNDAEFDRVSGIARYGP